MEMNVQTIPDSDPRVLSAEADAINRAGAKDLTAQEEPSFFIRSDAASHSQHDR